MGIDICFAKQTGDEWVQDGEESERIASTGGFFALTEVLSHLMEPLRGWREEFVVSSLKPFREFVEEGRGEKIERFRAYCEFINQANRSIREQPFAEGEMLSGMTSEVNPDAFDADVQAFMGGFVLCDEPIHPEKVDRVIPFIGFALGMIRHFSDQLKPRQPEIAEAFDDAWHMLNTLRVFCDKAVDEQRILFIDC